MTPSEILIEVSKEYPTAWKFSEMIRRERGVKVDDWPKWCFFPSTAYYLFICDFYNIDELNLELSEKVPVLAALNAWRYSQGIYRFDKDVYKAIIATEQKNNLPSELFFRLPEWCVYIESPGIKIDYLKTEVYGFWCHLEYDDMRKEEDRNELRILLNTDKGCIAVSIVIGNWTIEESVSKVISHNINNVPEFYEKHSNFDDLKDKALKIAASISPIISLILYICSEEPDIVDRKEPLAKPKKATPKKVKSGIKMFPADKPKIWEVGYKIGNELRKEYEKHYSDDKRSVKPHLRRAHWHGYWVGKRGTEEREFKYKWLHPIFVSSK